MHVEGRSLSASDACECVYSILNSYFNTWLQLEHGHSTWKEHELSELKLSAKWYQKKWVRYFLINCMRERSMPAGRVFHPSEQVYSGGATQFMRKFARPWGVRRGKKENEWVDV